MRRRMNVFGAYPVSRLKPPRALLLTIEGAARQPGDKVCRELARQCFARPLRAAGFELRGRHKTALCDVLLHRQGPAPVVRHAEIGQRRQLLLREAGVVNVPSAGVAHGALHRQNAAFPRRMKYRFVLLGLDLTEAVHAAHVVHAVHHETSFAFFGKPVPIMLSRVISDASLSSLQPSVPEGRIGSTMKRVSAVESQTRISVSLGSATPKSASTPRGSLTARER